MLKRVLALSALSLALGATAIQAQEDLFVLPGARANSGQVEAFVTNPLSSYVTFTAGVGSFAVLGAFNASKFYVIANSTTDTIIAADTTLLNPTAIASLSSPATQGIITPDGSMLAVAAGALHVFDTTTDTELIRA
jgi:hypothetical protein